MPVTLKIKPEKFLTSNNIVFICALKLMLAR